jgi:hypothetical protein
MIKIKIKNKTFYLISDSAWAGSLKRTAKSKLQQGRAGVSFMIYTLPESSTYVSFSISHFIKTNGVS